MAKRSTLIWGVGLLLLGVILLLQNLNLLGDAGNLIRFVLFLLGSVAFASVYIANRQQWWAIIPASALMGIALISALGVLWPRLEGRWSGPLFLLPVALGFLLVYVMHRENWWALIPGGTILSVALAAALAEAGDGMLSGGFLLLGMGLTFALLSTVSTADGRLRWALFPAGILSALGMFILLQSAPWSGPVVAVALIVAGGALVARGMKRTGRD
jgi:hypothetical protein